MNPFRNCRSFEGGEEAKFRGLGLASDERKIGLPARKQQGSSTILWLRDRGRPKPNEPMIRDWREIPRSAFDNEKNSRNHSQGASLHSEIYPARGYCAARCAAIE